MNRGQFAAIVIAIVIVVFIAMWLGWRARARRDSGVLASAVAPAGDLLSSFTNVLYVSTTPVGEPLTRVAAPGLRYRGQAEIAVYTDGVTVEVAGEDPTYFSASQLRGSGVAGRRVGKAVENEGLALMRWVSTSDERELESSFRFERKSDQRRFSEAIDQLTLPVADASAASTSTSQEDAK